MTPELSLRDAQHAILDRITILDPENIPLPRALGRISAVSLKSTIPKPAFDQSTRDGYAVAAVAANLPGRNDLVSFRLAGEVAAGDLDRLTVRRGEAVRIMTGAMLPVGTKRVVPCEACREGQGRVAMPATAFSEPCRFIRKRGSTLAAGRVLVSQGRSVRPDHLLSLGENNYTDLPVFRQPLVAVLCTGSELVVPGTPARRGQKISGNSLLLGGLLAECGAEPFDQGTVRDQVDDIAGALAACLAAQPQVILTTGGMGPGKYDLIEHVVDRLGGIVIYRGLQVRPGRATLFALLDNVPLFALPGPPPAVRLLFHELVAPALRKMQGRRRVYPRPVRARLTETVQVKKRGRLNLKGAVLSLERGLLRARPATATEAMNGILLLPAAGRRLEKGTAVTAHLVGRAAALF
ncbi:molybdopterin molybdenumtransferase [bacterium BMS3Bbin14]|nr:molybdopterin molybdenumtransferase [bacterium BMS3Abin13]GBE52578.1 molybdopterin molybdenumtransferase [bacterium BMS3Bbin14]